MRKLRRFPRLVWFRCMWLFDGWRIAIKQLRRADRYKNALEKISQNAPSANPQREVCSLYGLPRTYEDGYRQAHWDKARIARAALDHDKED